MKKILWLLFVTGFVPAICSAESMTETAINKDAQNPSFTQSIDVSRYSGFSAQVVYSTPSISISTFTDGQFSSATLTVTDYSYLNGQAAYATITLTDGKNTVAIASAVVTLGSKTFTEGTDWWRGYTSTNTMANLQTVINADWEYVATVSSNVVTVNYYAVGTVGNSYAMTTSTGVLECSAAALASGQPYGWFSINGTKLTEGTDWDAATSSAVTANSIEDAINDNATLSALMVATHSITGKVVIVSSHSGVNAYLIDISSVAALTPDFYRFYGGAETHIDLVNDKIAETSHGLSTGLPVLFSTVTNSTPPTGLTFGTTYYAISSDANHYQLSDTSTGAVAGLDVDITAVTGGGTFTVSPLAYAVGSAGFYWEGSNDGTNFSDLTSTTVSSVTYAGDGNTLWDFTNYPYKYLLFNFTGPTTGGIDIDAVLFGERR